MKEFKSLWKETKEKFDQLEKSLVDCYITFLRQVAKVYLQQDRRVLLEDYEEKALNAIASKALVQAVKRNLERFPNDFMFQLNKEEFDALRSQIVTSKGRGGRRYLPYVFTG